ncbi:MAG: cysteine hydrolase [archaeon]
MEVNKENTALLVLDMQNDMIHEKGKVAGMGIMEHAKKQNAIQNTKKLLEKARSLGVKVVFVKVEYTEGYPEVESSFEPLQKMTPQFKAMLKGTWGAEIHEELKPLDNEPVISKSRISPYTNPDFEKQIQGIQTLLLTGVATNWVVEAVARRAADENHQVIVVEDCCASMSQELHDFVIKNIFPNICIISNSDEIISSM